MDHEHAKQILLTYRLGEAALPGSDLAAALARAERDPDLARWLEEQLRFDRAVRSQLRSLSPPPGLREAILVGRPTGSSGIADRRWRPATALALAALLALVAGVGLVLVRRPPALGEPVPMATAPVTAESFRNDMALRLAEGRYSLEVQSTSLEELRRFLARNQGVADAALPAGVQALASYGCQVLDWKGRKVTLICFSSARLGFVHLMVLDTPPPEGVGEEAQVSTAYGWNTATWGGGGKTYLLCAQGTEADLRALLRS